MKKETRNVAIEAIEPFAAFCNKTIGTKAELAERMTAVLGYKIHRQIAEGWVHPDPEKRVEPKLGQGLVLMHVAALMMKGRTRINLGHVVKKGLNGHAQKPSPHDKKARPSHGKKKPDPREELADAQSGVGVKPKADVRKVLPAATQWPAKPKPRKA